MTDPETGPPTESVPEVLIEKRRGLPLVWLIPVVAAVVAAWLGWSTYSNKGPTITITFETAAGLEVGKTLVKYRDVTLGIVTDVTLSHDLTHVVVTAEMEKSAANQLHEDTEFWIENARVTASGVSGLGTLVSGAYIGVKPGSGAPATSFKGSEEPPVLQVTVPGSKYTLHSDKRGSIGANSPIYYRGIQVGEVLGSSLDIEANEVVIFAFVRAPYDAMVKPQTRFWNAGGVDVSLGAAGLHVRTESMVTLLVGGITFDTPATARKNAPSPEGSDFPLFGSYDDIEEAGYTQKMRYLLNFTGSVAGLEPGAPVTFRGMKIGYVQSLELEIDSTDYSVRVPVVIEIQPERAHIVGEDENGPPRDRMEQFIEKGLRAQLRSGSLLTGSLVVALDFFPSEPAATMVEVDGNFVIPTVPSAIEQLTEKATKFFDKLADAPVADLVVALHKTVQSVDELITSASLHEGIDGLAPLLESIKKTADSARVTLDSAGTMVGDDSALRHDLQRALGELTEMARSVRTLTDYLERNPNSLIFGKPAGGN
ncbi:MAG: intermembrane transport protein PqiB [Candidatus Binatia bacterium]